MKDNINEIKGDLLEFILKHNFIISILISVIILYNFHNNLKGYFAIEKINILNMLISISGTLFGFILTFLSIFIVFRTDEKYKKNKENEMDPLILLVNNESFNGVYELFIKSSYSLGILLIISIIFYFMRNEISNIINMTLISGIIELIVLCTIRIFLSIYAFNTLIKILINTNKKG